MPLAGGASDKAGNRFELLWTVWCAVQVVLGKFASVRPEPPSVEGIDLLVQRGEITEWHQVKLANGLVGKWSLSALKSVLTDFHNNLMAKPNAECVFVSSFPAPDLTELADRARRSEDLAEFYADFLAPTKTLQVAFSELCESWGVADSKAWALLRQIRVETYSGSLLATHLDDLLGVVFDGDGATTRAVFEQLVGESTHHTLTATKITSFLMKRKIYRRALDGGESDADALTPPVATDVAGREGILEECSRVLGARRALILAGPSGIGKTAILATICATLKRVFWFDGVVFSSFQSVVAALDPVARSLGVELDPRARHSDTPPDVVGRLLARTLDQLSAHIAWDDVTPEVTDVAFLGGLILGLRVSTISVTTKMPGRFADVANLPLVEVPPLSPSVVVRLLTEATGRRPSADVLNGIAGHPYLVQLAIGLLKQYSDDDAARLVRSQSGNWVRRALIASLSAEQARLLQRAAVYRAGFRSEWLMVDPGDDERLEQLIGLRLIIRRSRSTYVVHEIVRTPVLSTVHSDLLRGLHADAALRLLPFTNGPAAVLAEYAYHATQAQMLPEAQRATTAIAMFAAQDGHWSMVIETTEFLNPGDSDSGWSEAWYYRGRALRMMDDLRGAAECYRRAQNGVNQHFVTVSRYEEASVSALLGEEDTARRIYLELSRGNDAVEAIEADIALALMEPPETPYETIATRLGLTAERAKRLGGPRTLGGLELTWGIIALRRDRPGEALVHLRKAYESRMAEDEDSCGHDVIGWHAMYEALVEAETRLGHRVRARSAAFGLWLFAVISGNLRRIAEATYKLSLAAEPADEDASRARELLVERLGASPAGDNVRSIVGYLAASFWCAGDDFRSLCCHLQFDAEDVGIPVAFVRGERAVGVPPWFAAVRTEHMWWYFLDQHRTDEYMAELFERLQVRFPHSDRMIGVYRPSDHDVDP